MRITRKVEIQPTACQQKDLLRHAGTARWTYNWGLAEKRKDYARWKSLGKPSKWNGWRTAVDLHRELNLLKKKPREEGGVPWMYESSKCAPQEALRNLDVAFKNFFAKRAHYPKFKSRSKGVGGFRLTGSISVSGRFVALPRLGRLRLKPRERLHVPSGRYAQASVTEKAGRWYVSFGVDVKEERPNNGGVVGIDVGITRLATLSNGVVIENPRALAMGRRKLLRVQRALSRKRRGSSNRVKTRVKLSRAHARIANVRSNALHKATTHLAKSHGMIVIEDLKVRNMTRRGCGKRGLNRSMMDASLGEFRRMLEYKARLYGSKVIVVPPHHTSQRCSECGYVSADNRISQSQFHCLSCDHEVNADLNAAINILVAGSCPETLNACGDNVRLEKSETCQAVVDEAGIGMIDYG